MLLMLLRQIKKTSTAHPLSPNNRWASAEKVLEVPCRLMNANLRLIIAYWNIYVKSLYLFEHESLTGIRTWRIFLFLFQCISINLCAETRANNGTQPPFTLNHKNRIQATRPKIQRSLNNSYATTLISSRASQSAIPDCYLSVPGKDLILFNTYFKVSEKLNCDCREDRLCAKPINRSIAWAGHR